MNRERYLDEGFVTHDALSSCLAIDLATKTEQAIEAMSADLGVPQTEYLSAVCRWNTPNLYVHALMDDSVKHLIPSVSRLLGGPVRPGRASLFRKSASACLGTHGHQDSGYWIHPSSDRYDATTWITFDNVDSLSGALRVIPRSHVEPVGPPVDYLSPGFCDPADGWSDKARTLVMGVGTALTFEPGLWHASHGSTGGQVRRALAIRWLLDGSTRPSRSDTFEPSPDRFGMYTSGRFLHAALSSLAKRDLPLGIAGVEWAIEHDIVAALPNPSDARTALLRLLLYLLAGARHHASDQRGMVWESVRDLIVAPTVGLSQQSTKLTPQHHQPEAQVEVRGQTRV